jgi:hypothetical protein
MRIVYVCNQCDFPKAIPILGMLLEPDCCIAGVVIHAEIALLCEPIKLQGTPIDIKMNRIKKGK